MWQTESPAAMLLWEFSPWAPSTFSPWNLVSPRTISSFVGTSSRPETCVSLIYRARMENTSCNLVALGSTHKPSKKPPLRLSAALARSVILSPQHTSQRANLRSFPSSRKTRVCGKDRLCLSGTGVFTADLPFFKQAVVDDGLLDVVVFKRL